MQVYRMMKPQEDGLPMVDATMFGLGVRVRDIHPRVDGTVDPGTGGVSVSPSVDTLPRAARAKGERIFQLETDALPEGLMHREDPLKPDEHGFIEPAYDMRFEHYHKLIRETGGLWSSV